MLQYYEYILYVTKVKVALCRKSKLFLTFTSNHQIFTEFLQLYEVYT